MDGVPDGDDDDEPIAEDEDDSSKKRKVSTLFMSVICLLALTWFSPASGIESIIEACL